MLTRNQVKTVRVKRGITISELARRTRLSRQTIYTIESDNGYRPKSDVMFCLARTLNTDIGSLFWEEADAAKVPA